MGQWAICHLSWKEEGASSLKTPSRSIPQLLFWGYSVGILAAAGNEVQLEGNIFDSAGSGDVLHQGKHGGEEVC